VIPAITAWDNLSEDFSWVPGVIVWMGEVIANMSPLIALIGAIWLYFKKTSEGRHDELRRERLRVYLGYLAVLSEHSDKIYKDEVEAGLALVKSLTPFHGQITLMAPDDVVKASLTFLESNAGKHLWPNGQRLKMPSKGTREQVEIEVEMYFTALKPVRDARFALIKAMRKDIVYGTLVDEFLTNVEPSRD
jgi:hypothetical protein